MGEYMGSFKLGLSKLTMKLLLITAATAAIALAAPYNPYSPYNLSPIPSYYYSPYNAISGGVPSAVYGTYSNLYSPYNTVSYSNQVPTATNAQLKISPSYNIPKSASSNTPKSSSSSNAYRSPTHLDGVIPKGQTGNYIGKQLDKVAVLPSATSALANPPTASKANKDAMLAFINQAVNDGPEVFTDPVCGAATIAYLDSKIAGKTDKEAGADSAEAYIQAFAANGGKRTEACKRSAEAYIKTF